MSIYSANQVIDCEAYEEGEIIDVDNLEPISSDEEDNLRERIRELEARNAELEKLAALAKEERKTFNYAGDFVKISSEEELEERTVRSRRQVRNHRSPVRSRRRSPPSPNHRRRRRSASPLYGNRNNKYIRPSRTSRYRPRVVEHKREGRLKRKRLRRRSSGDMGPIDLSQSLEAALRHNENGRRRDENSLAKRLKLHEEHSNKENDSDDENEELIALRLQALQSKQEVKELNNEPTSQFDKTDAQQPEDEDEYELRMIALKSAITKKAETRRMQNRKPYSPTDELVPAARVSSPMPVASDNESNNNMEISPTDSPLLDDAVLQPIDMEIATPDNASNSPTFFHNMDDSNSLDQKGFENQAYDFHQPVPVDSATLFTHPTIETTKAGLPIGLVSLPVQEEIKENLGKRQNTRSPSNLIVIHPTTTEDVPKKDSRKPKRIRKRRQQKQRTDAPSEQSQPVSPGDDSEEIALRALLLAGLKNPQKAQKKKPSQPATRPDTPTTAETQNNDINLKKAVKRLHGDQHFLNIEDNLKRAAKRIKGLTEHEQIVIETSLDKILSGGSFDCKESPPAVTTTPTVNLKDVVERLKQKNSGNSPEVPPAPIISTNDAVISTKPSSPLVSTAAISTNELKVRIEPPRISAEETSKLPPKAITTAIKPSVQKKSITHLAPVIMKRKVKTKSSIVNVPFQPKPLLSAKPPAPSTSKHISSPVPGPSRLITENFTRPVPKVVIQLGQSSSDESSSDSDDYNNGNGVCTEADSGVQSKLASPSHIVEYSTGQDQDASHIEDDEMVATEPVPEQSSADPLFELKLEEFLKQARAKAETEDVSKSKPAVATPLNKPKLPDRTQVVKTPPTPTSLRHLPVSAQREYKALVAKMQLLEKQKNLRLRFQNIKSQVKLDGNRSSTSTANSVPLPTRSMSVSPTRIVNPNTPNSNDKPLTTSTPKPIPSSPHIAEIKNKLKPVEAVKPTPLTIEEKLTKMPEAARARMLDKSENAFKEHSGIFLNELKTFIVNIDEAYNEKRAQILLEQEVETLRAKLNAAASKLEAQKKKVATIFPAVTEKHKKILRIRDKYVKLGKCCTKIGNVVKGSDYQHHAQVKAEICEKLQVLGVKTKELRQVRQKLQQESATDDNKKTEVKNSYKSVLDCLGTESKTSDPDGILCPFEIDGQCMDKGCKYKHLVTRN